MEEDDFKTLTDADFDDGIYILATRRHFLSKQLEYRVAYVHNTEKMYDPEISKKIIRNYFDGHVYKNEDDAIAFAMNYLESLRKSGIEPQHGIGVIYKWEDITFKKLIGG